VSPDGVRVTVMDGDAPAAVIDTSTFRASVPSPLGAL
jgi:hypothetical protein